MKKVVLVGGCFRGGTSMVSGMLSGLGVPMAVEDELNPGNFEDGSFDPGKAAWVMDEEEYLNESYFTDYSAKRERAAKRVANLWGIKSPSMDRFAMGFSRSNSESEVLGIVVGRDAMAILLSSSRHEVSHYDSLFSIFRHQSRTVESMTRYCERLLCLSYEKSILYPGEAIRSVASFIGIDTVSTTDVDRIRGFMRPGGYKFDIDSSRPETDDDGTKRAAFQLK